MPSPDTIDVLNRVLVILRRSFPQYLKFARPYIPAGRENIMETTEEIVSGQDALAARVAEQIFESGALPDYGKFPIAFTDTHDLDIDFLVEEAIGYQKQDIAALTQCVDELRLAPTAQTLAAEALGMAKGHLESLEELPVDPTASTIIRERATAFANDMPVLNELTGEPHRQQARKAPAGDPKAPSGSGPPT
jgi:hypothetical protein